MRRNVSACFIIFFVTVALLVMSGCAAQKEAQRELESQKKQLQASQSRIRELEAQIKELQSKLDDTQSNIERVSSEKQQVSSEAGDQFLEFGRTPAFVVVAAAGTQCDDRPQ